jgi:pimeloyl-ACP methyl ester carboxylesterase
MRAHDVVDDAVMDAPPEVVREDPDPVEVAGATLVTEPHPGAERVVLTDDGAELAVTIVGDLGAGRPVALLAHGWGGRRETWGLVAPHLVAAGVTVVAYDLRGHGASTLGREPIGVERMGHDLGIVLEQLALRDAVVVGHCGGGFAAMSCVSGDPAAADRVRGLVLVATAAHDQDTPLPEVLLMGSRLLSFVTSRPKLGLKPLRRTYGRNPGHAQLDLTRHLFSTTPRKVRGACFRSSRGMDLRAGLTTVDHPAVVLSGQDDRLVPPRLGRAVAEAMPRARFAQVPEVGHMIPLEAPEVVADAILELTGRRTT